MFVIASVEDNFDLQGLHTCCNILHDKCIEAAAKCKNQQKGAIISKLAHTLRERINDPANANDSKQSFMVRTDVFYRLLISLKSLERDSQ